MHLNNLVSTLRETDVLPYYAVSPDSTKKKNPSFLHK